MASINLVYSWFNFKSTTTQVLPTDGSQTTGYLGSGVFTNAEDILTTMGSSYQISAIVPQIKTSQRLFIKASLETVTGETYDYNIDKDIHSSSATITKGTASYSLTKAGYNSTAYVVGDKMGASCSNSYSATIQSSNATTGIGILGPDYTLGSSTGKLTNFSTTSTSYSSFINAYSNTGLASTLNYQWYSTTNSTDATGTSINGATNSSISLTAAYKGAYLRCAITTAGEAAQATAPNDYWSINFTGINTGWKICDGDGSMAITNVTLSNPVIGQAVKATITISKS